MVKWPRSNRAQAAFAIAVAIPSSAAVFAQTGRDSFHDFYLTARKAPPFGRGCRARTAKLSLLSLLFNGEQGKLSLRRNENQVLAR
jgi:hypothetical protein